MEKPQYLRTQTETPSDCMSHPLKNKYLRVFGITFVSAILLLTLVYFQYLGPNPAWYNIFSLTYLFLHIAFAGWAIVSNLYSVATLILTKLIKKPLPLFAAVGPGISVAILVVFFIKPYTPDFLPSGSNIRPFNSEAWIGDDSTVQKNGITERQKMLGDVVDQVLPGKARNEIIRHLGLSSDDSNQPTLTYYLGPARGDFFGIADEWITIHFDSTGHYEKYEFYNSD